ncbi:MAG TPA: DUF1064 domain-containing protein [bacterium]|nr:DUF1064 domain-containing protein [bacterium]
MKPKYKNINYHGFASKKEYYRSNELKLLQEAGEITDLKEQVSFELLPSQFMTINGKKKCIERSVSYIADFTYKDKDDNLVVEDTKGFRTQAYIIKRKLMLFMYGIRIKEL